MRRSSTVTDTCMAVIQKIGEDIASAGDYGLVRASAHGGFNIWLDAGSSLGALKIRDQV